MKIFVIGQCTLHWGRMEFGNIGNYYIAEPFFRELYRVFPDAEIKTTFQMSEGFCERENVRCVPMDEYYGWNNNDLPQAYKELAIASVFQDTKSLIDTTPYIDDVMDSDLVIEFAGDIWGQNADFLGANRFLIGLIKDRVPQLLGKPTAMLASSPGPFNKDTTLPFARLVYESFDYVANRESVSREILNRFGFDTSKVVDAACPAFMFEPGTQDSIAKFIKDTPLSEKKRPVVGFILCGWNLVRGPYTRVDWDDEEFAQYIHVLTSFIKENDVDVCFMSHSNGFELPPHFRPIRGRDFPFAKKIFDLMSQTDCANHVFILDGVYDAKETKAIINNFDMLISGRVHGAIAGISQSIPTVIIDYGHEPKAHKLIGFARVAGLEEYIANPNSETDLEEKVKKCWDNRIKIRQYLTERNKEVTRLIKVQFDALKDIVPHNSVC